LDLQRVAQLVLVYLSVGDQKVPHLVPMRGLHICSEGQRPALLRRRVILAALAGAEMLVQRLRPEGVLQLRPQKLSVERFDQVLVCANLHAVGEVLLISQRREEDEVCMLLAFETAHPLAEFQPVHAWHQPVAKDHVHAGVFLIQLPRL